MIKKIHNKLALTKFFKGIETGKISKDKQVSAHAINTTISISRNAVLID